MPRKISWGSVLKVGISISQHRSITPSVPPLFLLLLLLHLLPLQSVPGNLNVSCAISWPDQGTISMTDRSYAPQVASRAESSLTIWILIFVTRRFSISVNKALFGHVNVVGPPAWLPDLLEHWLPGRNEPSRDETDRVDRRFFNKSGDQQQQQQQQE